MIYGAEISHMVDYTMRVVGALMAYASAEGNNTLLAKAKSITDTGSKKKTPLPVPPAP